MPSRSKIADAASGSVGATTAPSTKAAAQGSPIQACAASATVTTVTATSPIASSPIERMLRRRSRSDVKNAEA